MQIPVNEMSFISKATSDFQNEFSPFYSNPFGRMSITSVSLQSEKVVQFSFVTTNLQSVYSKTTDISSPLQIPPCTFFLKK